MAKRGVEVGALTHDGETRRNIPTAEYESVMREQDKAPVRLAYERRNRDLDPQLVWRGKDAQDWSDLVVQAPPIYIQEKCIRRSSSTTCGARRSARAEAEEPAPISSPISTGSPTPRTRRSSTSTTSTGRTG